MRLCLEDNSSFNLLYDTAQQLANADVPQEVVEALALSKLAALLKPNGRVRGGCYWRCFQALSKQDAREAEARSFL